MTTYAQQTPEMIQVKGSVSDSVNGKSIPYATITILNQSDNEVKKRLAATVNGTFSFEIEEGEYKLTASTMGYKTFEKNLLVNLQEKNIDLGNLQLTESSTELDAVEVVAQKQLIKVEADKIVYNTEADPDTKTITALDMLRRVPLITVDGDDNIQLKGSSNFKFHMNGKPSTLLSKNAKDVLKSMPASSIKNVEVVTSPGAKYDAEGTGGIINIITTEKSINGYTGSVNARANNLGWYSGGAMFSANLGKFAFSINTGGGYNAGHESRNETFRENFNSTEQRYQIAKGDGEYTGYHQWGNAAFSFEIDSLNLISSSFDFWGGDGQWENTSLNNLSDINNALTQSFTTISSDDFKYGSVEGSVDYQRTSKKDKERILTLSYKLSANPDDAIQKRQIISHLNYPNSDEMINSKGKNNEHTFQLDYALPLTEMIKMEVGSKYILRLNNNVNESNVDNSQNIDFDYTQNIVAGYVSFNGKYKKLGYKAGVRVENSEIDGKFVIGDSPNFNNSSLEYVPSASISYQMGKMNSLQLAYAKRIQRPSIWYLNPYVDDSDPKVIRYGNPQLDPEHFHQIDLNYNIFMEKGNINLSSFYSYSDNGINRFSRIDENDIVYTTYQNIAKQKSLGNSINMNLNLSPKISVSTNFTSTYTQVENNTDADLSNSGWSHGGYGQFKYNFAKNFKLSAYGGAWSPRVQLQSKGSLYHYYGLSITREFLKEKLSVSIAARDFLEKERKYTWELFDPSNFNIKNDYFRPSRSFSISINYRFGEMKGGVKRARKTIRNDDVKSGGGNNGGGGGGGQGQ